MNCLIMELGREANIEGISEVARIDVDGDLLPIVFIC